MDAEGVLQHVMARGIERRDLFRSGADREDFVGRMALLAPATGTAVLAWSLMPNHFHLLLRSGPYGLATFMKRLQTGYAGAFNHRYRRSGHLFQNRFKSIVVDEGGYLLELVRYIHLNPIRAGVVRTVRSLDSYPWSGHAVLLGRKEAGWQETREVLRQFGRTRESAKKAYRAFVAGGVSQGNGPDRVRLLSEIGAHRRFEAKEEKTPMRSVNGIAAEPAEERSGDGVHGGNAAAELPPKKGPETVALLKRLLESVCEKRGIDPERVRGSGRERILSEARAEFARVAVRGHRVPAVEISRFLSVSSARVSQMVNRVGNAPVGNT